MRKCACDAECYSIACTQCIHLVHSFIHRAVPFEHMFVRARSQSIRACAMIARCAGNGRISFASRERPGHCTPPKIGQLASDWPCHRPMRARHHRLIRSKADGAAIRIHRSRRQQPCRFLGMPLSDAILQSRCLSITYIGAARSPSIERQPSSLCASRKQICYE